MKLETMLHENERLAVFGTTASALEFLSIIPKGYKKETDDIAAFLKRTLDRLKEKNATDNEICCILGAKKGKLTSEHTKVDKEYSIPGKLVFFYPKREDSAI